MDVRRSAAFLAAHHEGVGGEGVGAARRRKPKRATSAQRRTLVSCAWKRDRVSFMTVPTTPEGKAERCGVGAGKRASKGPRRDPLVLECVTPHARDEVGRSRPPFRTVALSVSWLELRAGSGVLAVTCDAKLEEEEGRVGGFL